ncbi:uncharacterized protein LOC144477595, partial [Augochlora pura]
MKYLIKNHKGLSIIQANLHRCRLAQDLLIQYVLENNIHIAIVSEPHRIPTHWFVDENGDAAIWVAPSVLKSQVCIKSLNKEKGFVAIKLDNIVIYSCYISPNITIQNFEEILFNLEKEIDKTDTKKIIIAGDLNAKSVAWGSRLTDVRGYKVMELANRNDLILVRSEGEYTFERSGFTSLIDIILCGRDCFTSLTKSAILDVYTASDHRYILHLFKGLGKKPKQNTNKHISNKLHIEEFGYRYSTWADTHNPLLIDNNRDIDNYINKVKNLIKLSMKNPHPSKHDPWGKPYKWVINTLNKRPPPNNMNDKDITNIINSLFITKPTEYSNRNYYNQDTNSEEDDIKENEVLVAVKKVKKRAMGLDDIPSEAVWALGNNALKHLTHIFKTCFQNGYFPNEWKNARVILIPKKQNLNNSSWRPLCIISNWAKAFEYCLKEKLNKYITYRDNQFGFTK